MTSSDFWEPVKIVVDSRILSHRNHVFECSICGESRRKAVILNCCTGLICKPCSIKWFCKQDVKCPYCREDIRDHIDGYYDEDNKRSLHGYHLR